MKPFTFDTEASPVNCRHGLKFLWLEITQKCNLECVHCYADSSPSAPLLGAMTERDWLRVIDESFAAGCRQLQLIGGEPTLHPAFPKMLAHAHNRGYTFLEVFTNATNVSEVILDMFSDFNVHVACSFYSTNPATHDQITQRKGSQARTLATIKRIVERSLPLRVGVIGMDENSEDIEASMQLLRELGVPYVSGDRIRGVGRGRNSAPQPHSHLQDDVCGHCWDGKLCVTNDGTAYPCIMTRSTPVGNVLTSTISEILASRGLNCIRETIRLHFADRTDRSSTGHALPSNVCFPDSCQPTGPCSPNSAPCWPQGCSPTPCGPDACIPKNAPCFPVK